MTVGEVSGELSLSTKCDGWKASEQLIHDIRASNKYESLLRHS